MGISFTSLAVVAAAAFAAPLLEPVQVLALIGLSFLLLIAGLEVDYDRLRGRLLRVTGLGFLVSLAPAGKRRTESRPAAITAAALAALIRPMSWPAPRPSAPR